MEDPRPSQHRSSGRAGHPVLAGAVGCLPCRAGILPESVQPPCDRSCTYVHRCLQIVPRIQLIRDAQLPSGDRGRRFKSSHPDQRFRGSADCRLRPTAGVETRARLLTKHYLGSAVPAMFEIDRKKPIVIEGAAASRGGPAGRPEGSAVTGNIRHRPSRAAFRDSTFYESNDSSS